MKGLWAAVILMIGETVMAAPAAAVATTHLTPVSCPFASDAPTHRATCSRFTREDDGLSIAFDVAVLTPSTRKSIGHVLYIPGGPGEAPVSEDGLFDDLLIPFANRTVVLFNPRGTRGTEPRLACDFGALVWDEDFGDAAAQAILRDCIARFGRDGPDPARFTSLDIAEDIDALAGALGILSMGLYGISYGTEAGLHLVAQEPDWLEFAILDSVSVPGVSGTKDEIKARDRFLTALDRLCFAGARCPAIARGDATTLSDWAAQFDDAPLGVYVQDDVEWTLESTDILDYLSQLGAYRNGLDLALALIGSLETGRLRALGWIRGDIVSNTAFMAENLPLMLQAYADTYDPGDADIIRRPTRYPLDLEDAAMHLDFYRLWRGARAREARFLKGEYAVPGIPVLVLSGGLDPFTPVEWAEALHRRLGGLQHYIFPHLGHAVSINTGTVSGESDITTQMHCAGGAVRAFLDPTLDPDDLCQAYRAESDQ